MKIICVAVFACIWLSAIAQKNDTTYFETDSLKGLGKKSNGLKQGKWLFWYQNSQKQSEGVFFNDKPVGLWKNWRKDGKPLNEINYDSLGLKNGRYIEFDYTRNESLTLNFIKDTIQGPAVWRHFRGVKLIEGSYKDGVREGLWKWFYPSGNVQAEGMMKNGKNHGKWIYYYDNGKIESEGMFINGKKQGEWKWYDEIEGFLMLKGAYKDDLKEGVWIQYDKGGNEITSENYRDDELIGE